MIQHFYYYWVIKKNCAAYLRNKGWDDEQISFYENSRVNLELVLEFYFEREIINILLFRYALLLYKYGSTVGQISRSILNNLIIEVSNLRIEKMFDRIEGNSSSNNNDKQEDIELFTEYKHEYLTDINGIPYIHGAQIMTDIRGLLQSYIKLVDPSAAMINNSIEKLRKSIGKLRTTQRKRALNESKITGSKYLTDIYEEYKSKLS